MSGVSVLRASFATTVGSFTVDASFDAGPGITALFGPSGAGKSVTLATVAGLLRPATGRVVLHGEVVADPTARVHVPTQERHVGMVFQDAALLPHRSPVDNVALAIDRGVPRAVRRDRARALLRQVHAEHLAGARTVTLSGGEQQRVALARALAGEPRLLLLDEPFSALDQSTRVSLRRLVRELVDQTGIAAVLVTHDVDDITHLADRVVRFVPGRTIETVALEPGDRAQLAHVLGLDL
jgi:molybdate transport system ATP-binding protein